MKLRESGMPEEAYWDTLFDVPRILDRLEMDARLKNVVELGCGYGTFSIPVARRICGTLTTFDVEEAMVERTRQRAAEAGVWNILYVVRDVFADGFGVRSASQDACLLFNILHGEEPVRLLAEAARVVRPGGAVLVIHWRYDPTTPRGPSLDIRPRPEQILDWANQTELLEAASPTIDLPPWHYGLRLRRRTAPLPFAGRLEEASGILVAAATRFASGVPRIFPPTGTWNRVFSLTMPRTLHGRFAHSR